MRTPLLLCITLTLAACRERPSGATATENPSLATFGAMQTLLHRHDNQDTSPPAPPQGLYFVAARYPAACFAPDTPAQAVA